MTGSSTSSRTALAWARWAIYELFASGAIDVDAFEAMMIEAIAGIAK